MVCSNCGKDLAAGAKFCSDCGAKVASLPEVNVAQHIGQVTNGGAALGAVQAPGGNVFVGGKHTHAGETQRELPDLRKAYLNRVLEETHSLPLAGIDPKAASQARETLDLEAVYTALLTFSPEEHARQEQGESPGERGTRRTSALDQLDRQPRLVLLGDPGSGKSTFVKFVALCLAGEALGRADANLKLLTAPLPPEEDERRLRLSDEKEEEPQPQPWRHAALLPVAVTLRDFAARGLPQGERGAARHLWDFIAAGLSDAALGDYAPRCAGSCWNRAACCCWTGWTRCRRPSSAGRD